MAESVLPPGLPDMRAAQRLLDVLGRVEAHMATTRPLDVPAELAFLRARAVTLEGARLQAIARLDKILANMEASAPVEAPDACEEAA